MNRSPILFRCDGHPAAGWESLYQCLVLAAALQRRRRPTYFLSHLEPTSLALPVGRAGNEVVHAEAPLGSDDDLRFTLQQVRKLDAASIVVAGTVNEDYLAELSAAGVMVTAIDCEAKLRFNADLVINPMLAPGLEDYHFRPGTQLVVGQRYAFVRPMIRRLRPLRSQEPPTPFRALVALGDDGTVGDTCERVRQLLEVTRVDRVDVAVRSHHPQFDELKAMAAAEPERIEVVTEPSELNTRLGRVHVAVTRGDGWSLELACLGVPQVLLVQEERHRANAEALAEENAAILVGDDAKASATALRSAVASLLNEPADRLAMSRCARHLIDGRGPDRMVNALEILLHPAKPMSLRLAA